MGLFFDLMQQSALNDQHHSLRTLEERVGRLEAELRQTREVLFEALRRLEQHSGNDLDGDGQVGGATGR